MLTVKQALTVLNSLLTILPLVIAAVREGRIRAAGQDEALQALIQIHAEKVAKAKAAAADASKDKASWKR